MGAFIHPYIKLGKKNIFYLPLCTYILLDATCLYKYYIIIVTNCQAMNRIVACIAGVFNNVNSYTLPEKNPGN